MASDLSFWKAELESAGRVVEPYFAKWQENLDYYTGTPLKTQPSADYVNVNVDVYQVEQKTPQLFFETPKLQLSPGSGFEQLNPWIVAHQLVLNALLDADQIDILTTAQKAIKDCTCTAGRGALVLGYQPTIQPVDSTPQPGAILGLSQPTPVPIHEAWFADRIPSKKFRAPADFADTDFDKAPWLAMDFRIPLAAAKTICDLPPDFTGTKTRDDKVLESGQSRSETTNQAYVDGTLVWYKAYLFDDDVFHPELYRRHIVIDGLDNFADRDDLAWRSPYQTLDPTGRLTADSMRGNPIDVWTLRDVPDSQFPPSDSQLTRPLVKEQCLFRTQMVNERDINKPKFGYNTSTIPPTALTAIEQAMTGSLIPLPAEAFAGGLDQHFKLLAQGTSPRQTYIANDYIERDIQKTLGIGANQAGVINKKSTTATEISTMDQALAVRLDADRKRVLRCYLRVVDKVSALALRFLTDPRRVAELIGPQAAPVWLQGRQSLLQSGDPRPTFTARPNSQIKLDAAQELTKWIKIYEFARKDPLSNGAEILKKVYELAGEDPMRFVAAQPPQHKPDPSLGYSFKGEDFNPLMPQQPIVMEILAQCGIQISQTAIGEAQAAGMNSVLMNGMPAPATAKPAAGKVAAHGGPADKVPAITKQTADQTGNRPGPSVQ